MTGNVQHEHPIIFNGEMVRAILCGRKTQTRRLAKLNAAGRLGPLHSQWHVDDPGAWHACPYGHPGESLWLRETCRAEELGTGEDGVRYPASDTWRPIDDTPEAADAWIKLNAYRGQHGAPVPAIHMPRWASRITLEITGVRVQYLQQITVHDARQEGCRHPLLGTELEGLPGDFVADERTTFAALWDGINKERGFGWEANPWVWVIDFQRLP